MFLWLHWISWKFNSTHLQSCVKLFFYRWAWLTLSVLCFVTRCLLWLCVIRLLSFSGLIIAVISRGATVSVWLCSKMSFGQRAWTSSRMNDCISHYPQCWVCILSSLLELNWRVFLEKKKSLEQKEGVWDFAPSTPCWFTPHLILKWEWKLVKYWLLPVS